jgi:hypothetical protein
MKEQFKPRTPESFDSVTLRIIMTSATIHTLRTNEIKLETVNMGGSAHELERTSSSNGAKDLAAH